MYDKTEFLRECNTIFRLIFAPCTLSFSDRYSKEDCETKMGQKFTNSDTQLFKMCVHWSFNNNTDIVNYANAASSSGAVEDCYLAFLPSSTV